MNTKNIHDLQVKIHWILLKGKYYLIFWNAL